MVIGLLVGLLSGGGSSLLSALLLGRDVSLVLAVLSNELDEVINSSGALVGDRSVLATGGEELDGGEALDLIGNVVGSGVDLGNDNLVLEVAVGELGSELIVLGGESLAVTAPGSVELEEDILVVIEDNVVVALGNNNGDGALLGLGDGLGLDAGLNLAGNEVVDELGNLVVGDLLLLVEGELLVLGDLLDSERGELVGLEVQVAGVSTESLSINGGEVDLAAVLLSNGLESLGELLSLLGGLGEDVGKGNTGRHVSGVGLGANLANEGSGGGDNEVGDGVELELLGEGVLALVKGLVENDGGNGDTLGLSESGIVDTTEEVVITHGLSNLSEGLVGGLVIGGEVGDNDDLVGSLELLKSVLGQDGNGGEGLLDHVGGDTGNRVSLRF